MEALTPDAVANATPHRASSATVGMTSATAARDCEKIGSSKCQTYQKVELHTEEVQDWNCLTDFILELTRDIFKLQLSRGADALAANPWSSGARRESPIVELLS